MASDQDIAEGLAALFRETHPSSFTSFNDVILRLQSKLGFDLSNKINFIRDQITLLFSPPPAPPALPPTVIPRTQILNPNPNPNPNLNPHPHQHVYRQPHHPTPQSHFPPTFGGGSAGHRGPTEISFGQPCASAVVDSHSSTPAKESAQSRPKRRGGPGGLNKLCGVSPQLQAIVGHPAMARTEIVKQLWAYIRKHNLQDPSNKRKIICNDELRLVFETDSTDMFQMNKLLAKHIVPLDSTKDLGQQSKKVKREDSEVPSTEAAPSVISEALAKFFGTSEKEMLQSEVYKRIEEYIKVEGLEDPLNSMVICDTKLQELFGCESIPTPGIREALARNHLSQRA
uniref:DM2 domain-containing protein n=1 Tax=Opuntia streptacantha TaxID=393608 RepID=A0A7C9AUU0_OPUST